MDLLIPSTGLLFWMTIVFLIVLAVLWKWGFPAITKMVKERKDYIDDSLRKAHEANEKLANIQKEGESILQEAREKQAAVLKEATATRDAIIAKAENQAKDRGAQLINDAKAEIEQEKQQAIREIRGQVAELSDKIAEKIIKQQLATDDKQMELINKILDDVAVSDKAAIEKRLSMDTGVIAVRYAKALLESAIQLKQEGEVYAEMQTLSTNYIQVPQLRFTIDNPTLGNEKKLDLLKTACGGNASDLTVRFLELVFKEGRESSLQFMATAYLTLYRKHKNIIRGKLTTAVPVSQETEAKMKQMVENRTHGNVEFNTEVDPSIIGGFILEYDTYSFDASVRTKLKGVLHELTV